MLFHVILSHSSADIILISAKIIYKYSTLLKHLSVSKKAVIIRSKINEKQLVAIIIAELSDKSIHKSAIVYTKAQPDYWLHC